MRKLALCLFYALCTFTIAFSLFWMALPRLNARSPAPQDEADSVPLSLAAQALPERTALYYLCDEGGRVVVYTCTENGLPDKRLLRTGIYVNLLPEADAIRLKQGFYVSGETALRAQLEDLGG